MKLSIITICFNSQAHIASAVESVLSQSYSDVEYILVDGGSTDGTVEKVVQCLDVMFSTSCSSRLGGERSTPCVNFCASCGQKEVRVVSEPDNGLYDALNKGVRMATGDVIGFVHADDFLAHSDVLKHVVELFEKTGVEAVYGDLQYVVERSSEHGVKRSVVENSPADPLKARGEVGGQKSTVGQKFTTKNTKDTKVSLSSSVASSEAARRLGLQAGGEKSDHPLRSSALSCGQNSSNLCSLTSNLDFSVVRHWRSGEYDRRKLKWGWMPPHPTFYLKKSVYERAVLENGEYFDTFFSCAADYDFMMRILSKLNLEPVYLPEVMVKMRIGGVSNRSLKHIVRKSFEDWCVIRRNQIGHIHTLVWKNLSKVLQFVMR